MFIIKFLIAIVVSGWSPCLVVALPKASLSIEQLQNSYRVHQIEVKGHRKSTGPEALLAAHYKFNKKPSAELVAAAAAAAKEQSGTVAAKDEIYDKQYLCQMKVGQQTMQLVFDTGSSDFWVFSTELPKSQQGSHVLYKLEGHKDKGSWGVAYGDGSRASGNIYADKVAAGPITATVQAVEAATHVSKSFTQGLEDGIVGFGFDFIGNTCQPGYCYTFFTQVAASLPHPILVAVLKHNTTGHYDFGFLDKSEYTGSIAYETVYPDNSYWQFTARGYAFGNNKATFKDIQVIADTGTSLLLLPQKIVDAYWKKVHGSSYSTSQSAYIFPCSATLPSFSLYINNQKRTMPGAYANYRPLGSGMCYGGIQRTHGLGVIGDVFLKSQYVVFDRSTPRVGFAQQA